MTTEERAARKGARWLDKNHPGWAQKIDIRTLQMRNGYQCVLGQCFGGFWAALEKITKRSRRSDVAERAKANKWATDYGFQAQTRADGLQARNGSYERLGLAWAPLVAIRQMRETLHPTEDS